ncbi:MAG: arsenosugar biosynthesis-associated peroxidase-like protein [Flavobacteriales bacterium]|nr:arsenosugar biosynthesis-associated peroxidase-like protein [Cyclobacteriaceae bacterium]MCB0788604.1 arsenosugar biosynthesis-associated peroxidase-like protein [Flavobacteriales bacterium]MCB0816125.1 arsenosugar biosynthesis-associated peroxidase-like protein [Flavobacteriales bacterium]MCB9181187.1 carboxymuconolactone decarboxylase family protein [Flavobacteriales bacterium]MCB9199434.1 carboxymuconolactone decarboxylase family protein [Flavobacteriales bacterium]
MSQETYYDPADLGRFGDIAEWDRELARKFFDWYGEVFKEGALTEREKSLIALAVSHAIQCPYCIDAYTQDGLQRGVGEEEMMEAVHVAAAIRSGASLVHGTQMMGRAKKMMM